MLRNYLKIALKVLLRRKFFTAISLFAIAFTLLVLMVATALLDHTLAPMAPETNADRMLFITKAVMRGPNSTWSSSAGYLFLDKYVRTLPDVEAVAVATDQASAVGFSNGVKVRTSLRRTDGVFWQILDFDFVEGRPFTGDDDREARRVAVINEATRERYFGDASALGRDLEVANQTFRVVGVVRDVPFSRGMSAADVWVPIGTLRSDTYKRELLGPFIGIILARHRGDLPAIQAEVQRRAAEVPLPDPKEYEHYYAGADTLFESAARSFTASRDANAQAGWLVALLVLSMLLFMLLPALNLVNLNLSRILERASEIGVRKAFGASSRALVGQFVVENVVLTFVGGAIGLALSALALVALNRGAFVAYANFGLNLRVFFYAVLLSLFFGVLSGVYPAWKMSRLHPAEAIRGGRR
jgi:putative ABC transport system permease protein